ncbi:phasin family protein [Massilia sp. 9096]|uniref:phasin family protein n=1 Tax=Massilia sp. 9096 TaxID=1500894 RepID=UPI0027D7B284|nr:phasin family protein [Massilia sp. 9096]
MMSEVRMYPFPRAINPAVRTHVDAQTAFLNDVSKSMFKSFQQVFDLNIQLVQTMLEETTLAGKQMLNADRQTELLSAATARAQPASDKLRAYQQHIARLAADAQVELARVTEQHLQNTSRTAQALAEEVARDASEQTERGLRAQQETARQYADPFSRSGEGDSRIQRSNGDGQGIDEQGVGQQHSQSSQQQPGGQQRSATAH